jgi:hypothetical protein
MPWFAFKAIDMGHKPGCSLIVFFFGDIYLYDRGWRIVAKAFSVVAVVFAFTPLQYWYIIKCSRDYLTQEDTESQEVAFESSRRAGRGGARLTVPFRLAIFAFPAPFAIGFVETTLTINHIDMSASPITAAGQLIPLIIGAYILLTTASSILWDHLNTDDETASEDSEAAVVRPIQRDLERRDAEGQDQAKRESRVQAVDISRDRPANKSVSQSSVNLVALAD